MVYLVIGSGPATLGYEQALRHALDTAGYASDRRLNDGHVLRVPVDKAAAALRRGGWEGVILNDAAGHGPELVEQALLTRLPLLIARPADFSARELALQQHNAQDSAHGGAPNGGHAAGSALTVGFFGPVSPGIAALGLELAHCASDASPVSVLVEQQLAPHSDADDFTAAILEAVISAAHLAGNWPACVAAIGNAPCPQATAVTATLLSGAATTIGLQIGIGAGTASRRIRVVTPNATLILEEARGGGVLVVDAEDEPLARASGDTADAWAPTEPRRIPVAAPEATRAIVDRFLRRIRDGGADDFATLIYGLTLTERLLESAQQGGRMLDVGYRADVQESPRLHLLRGGRAGAPAVGSRPSFTIIR